MKLPVIAASLVLASTAAYAQAPGDYYEGGDLAPPSMVPVAPVVAAPPPPQRRWSVGLGVGAMDLAPHSAPDSSTSFDIGQLYVRYRPWRRLELELALGGGGEADNPDTGMNSGREVSSAVFALRYRFNPQRRWNFHIMAGMGSISVTRQGATDEEREAAHQSTLQFGAGVERRWNRFALQFEIRAVGIAPREEGDVAAPAPDVPLDQMTPPNGGPTRTDDGGMAGGQFVLSGNYYF
jgi:hypothetical protein